MSEVATQQGGGGDAPGVAPAQGEGEQQQPQQQTWGQIVSGTLTRLAFMWMLMSWMKGSNNQQQQQGGNAPAAASAAGRNLFAFGERVSLWVYVNEIESFSSESSFSQRDLFWKLDDIEFGSWTGGSNNDGSFGYEGKIKLSDQVKNNGSLYLHAFLTKPYHIPFKTAETLPDELYDADYTVYRSKRLNRYKKRTIKNTKNLLTGETATDKALLERAEKFGNVEIISHWHPNLTINLVNDQTPWKRGMVPEPMAHVVNFDKSGLRYEPILYLNDYWNLIRDHQPINETVEEVELNVMFAPLSLFKLQMYVTQASQKQQWFNMMSDQEQTDEEQDALKEAILDTNPYMLALTAVVSIVHSIFEFLAFKNDIQFWKTRDSLVGLSVRSILTNIIQSLIVFLYVLDNDTSFIIKVSLFVGVLIDAWKITKVVNVKIHREKLMLGFIPTVSMEDKSTYVESETKKYDDLAFKYLGWLLFPLLIAYCVYSLMYEEHKGVYSFVLSMSYGFLLTFGFIMMTPQLFINYKLKSVAHLPWRMLTYKALNTFVDDIFAFVIKMPTLYRIGCFRDDLVFFVYLYQRYKYRVDPKRVNEFGTTGEQLEQPDEQPAIAATDQAPPEVGDKKND